MQKITNPLLLKLKANQIRQDMLYMLYEAKSGHTAGPLGLVEIFVALYFNLLNHDPQNPKWDKRDRVVLSNGHVCPVLYTTLAHCGYFDKSLLKTLRKLHSPLQGHPHRGELAGIENSSGPLGQGLSQACGMALAARLDKKEHLVFCITSDGEQQEGQTWEAVMFAAKYKIDNLIQIIDRNFIQIDGNTEDIMPLGDLKQKYLAFGWEVLELKNANKIEEVLEVLNNAISLAKQKIQKPIVVIAYTTPGRGVSIFENDYRWHGKAPTEKELKIAIEELEREKKQLEMQLGEQNV
ncbi:MAG: transketolase [Candidatus Anstonellaceae archaeon]